MRVMFIIHDIVMEPLAVTYLSSVLKRAGRARGSPYGQNLAGLLHPPPHLPMQHLCMRVFPHPKGVPEDPLVLTGFTGQDLSRPRARGNQ